MSRSKLPKNGDSIYKSHQKIKEWQEKSFKEISRLAAFTELNPRPIIETDMKGNIIYENHSAQIIFPDLKKKGIKHGFLSDFKKIAETLKKEEISFTREIKIKHTWWRQAFYKTPYIPDFESIRIYGLDVTDNKQAESNLKKSELRYHSLFTKMSEGYALHEIILDKKGRPYDYRFLDLNPAFEELTGLKRQAAVGKTVRQLLPNTEPAWIKDYGQVALTGKPIHFERYHQDLDKYYEVFAYQPEKMQVAVLFLDITARKHVEKEKDNFIAIMSHELRNPLTPILTSAQLLEQDVKNHLDPKSPENRIIREYAQIIERQSKTMARLLDDILDTSRMSRKTMQLNKKIVDVGEIVKNAVETTMPLIKEQRHNLSVSLPQHPVYMEADPVRLEQIIVNLLNNASKYTRPKGKIWVALTIKNKSIEITVKDNGMGINPEKIKRIFKLFSTADNVPFIAIGSLGIGTNIAKHLATMHGGKITASSRGKNRGSTFTVKFPWRLKEHKQEKIGLQKPVLQAPIKSKILIVDDNKDIASLLSKILSPQGHEVKVTHDGLEAIKLFKTFEPQIALIDIGLPFISGYQVAQKIRKQKSNQKTKLIAITGYGQDKDKLLAKQAGFDHHLTKPINIKSLMKIIS